MSINTLALPEDIPWRRIAVSEDMCVARGARLPARWRSSLTVYSFEPEPDPAQPDVEERTVFLKVSASITGFQPDGAELGVALGGVPWRFDVRERFRERTGAYYPALAAIVQVAVFPDEGDWALRDYPYFADFEPKKRELVELVTETGESLTQSSNAVNVRKGTTSTDATEIANIDRGGSFGFSAQGGGFGIGVQGSIQREVGTRARLGTEAMNMVTTDASREKREAYSHTTNLSQLYQLLQSYHAGTNRALFFVNARPHVLQSELTFVNGPRLLEGIQDLFLIVRRPKRMERICVRAILETAHIRESRRSVPVVVPAPAPVPPLRQSLMLPTFEGRPTNRWTVPIPAGMQIDRAAGGGEIVRPEHNLLGVRTGVLRASVPPGITVARLEYGTLGGTERQALPQFVVYDDHVDVSAGVDGGIGGGAFWRCDLLVHLRRPGEDAAPPSGETRTLDLFLTGRQVSSCQHGPEQPVPPGPWVSYETQLGQDAASMYAGAHGAGMKAAQSANAFSRAVAEQVVRSFQDPVRHAPGEVPFEHSELVMGDLRAALLASGAAALAEPMSTLVPEALRAALKGAADWPAAKVLGMPPRALAAHAGMTVGEAYDLHAFLVGAAAVHRGEGAQPAIVVSTADEKTPD